MAANSTVPQTFLKVKCNHKWIKLECAVGIRGMKLVLTAVMDSFTVARYFPISHHAVFPRTGHPDVCLIPSIRVCIYRLGKHSLSAITALKSHLAPCKHGEGC